jgi:hypothetical protein
MSLGFILIRTSKLILNATYCLVWGSVGGFLNLAILESITKVREATMINLSIAYAFVFLMLWTEYRAAPNVLEKGLFAISRVLGWTSVLAILWLNVTALSANPV